MAPFRLDVVYDRGYGFSLHAADGSQFWLGSDGMIPTWSSAGWIKRFGADLFAEIDKDADDFYRVASTIGGYIVCSRATASARRGGRSTRLAGCIPRLLTAST